MTIDCNCGGKCFIVDTTIIKHIEDNIVLTEFTCMCDRCGNTQSKLINAFADSDLLDVIKFIGL